MQNVVEKLVPDPFLLKGANHLLLPQIMLKKTKRDLVLVSLAYFLHDFWRKKNIFQVIFY